MELWYFVDRRLFVLIDGGQIGVARVKYSMDHILDPVGNGGGEAL